MLSNAYFLAKFRFDTAENEPAKNLQNFADLSENLQIDWEPNLVRERERALEALLRLVLEVLAHLVGEEAREFAEEALGVEAPARRRLPPELLDARAEPGSKIRNPVRIRIRDINRISNLVRILIFHGYQIFLESKGNCIKITD